MATRRWLGAAAGIKQVESITVGGTWLQNETAVITVNNIGLTVTIGTLVTTAQVATTIKQAFNGETLTDTSASASPTIAQGGGQAIPELAAITASIDATDTSKVLLTADTAGEPFVVTVTETSTSGTASQATDTAATGKYFWNNVDNWSGNTVPVDGDDVVYDSGSVDCKHALSTGIQPASLTATSTYTGKLGLREINTDDTSNTYPEYRTPKALTFANDVGTSTTTVDVGEGAGTGSQMIRLDFADCATVTMNVFGSGSRLVTGQPTLLVVNTATDAIMNVQKGDVGVAFFDGEAAHIATLRVGDGTTGNAVVVCGSGADLGDASIDVSGGSLEINSATGTGDIDISNSATMTIRGSGAHSSIDIRSGTCDYRSSGTITTLAVGSAGVFTRIGDLRPATITNVVNLYKGSTFRDPHSVLTVSGGLKVNGARLSELGALDVGPDRTYSLS